MSRPNNLLRERSWLYDTLFLLVLFLAAYLRLTGVNWGEGQHQHPDENFFSSVAESLRARTCEDPTVSVDVCPADQRRWISLGEGYGIHGTIEPDSVGKSESRGCVRMHDKDVEIVYDLLTIGSEVVIQR